MDNAHLLMPHNVHCGPMTNPAVLGDLRGLIFDCDGVIFDSRDANAHFYNAILDRLGLGPMTEEQTAFVHMATVWESLDHIVPPERRDDIQEAMARVSYAREVLPMLRPEPGFYELVRWAFAQGLRLGISTNRSTTMDNVVHRFGLRRFFHPVMTSIKVRAKPHPEGVRTILAAWGLAPENVLYIGDSVVDERTARAAGVRLAAYKNTSLQAALHLGDFWSFRECLQRHPAFDGCGRFEF